MKYDILVVEDEQVLSRAIRKALEAQLLFSVRLAHTLAEALAVLSPACFVDAVVADLNLPDSKGLDTVSSLRAAAPQTAIVVVTGDFCVFESECLAAGADFCLTKPFAIPALTLRMLRAIEKRRVEHECRLASSSLAIIRQLTDSEELNAKGPARVLEESGVRVGTPGKSATS